MNFVNRSAFSALAASDVAAFVRHVLLSPHRTHAVVGLTAPLGGPLLNDPAELAALVGPDVEVAALSEATATWTLAHELPRGFGVFGGATRLWLPGLSPSSDCYQHPLWLRHTPTRLLAQRIRSCVTSKAKRERDPRPRLVPTAGDAAPSVTPEDVARAKAEVDNAKRRLRAPLASDTAFLASVKTAYADLLRTDAERARHPLSRVRLGPDFLASARALQGISVTKIIEVCVQVACGLAHTLASREVHQLRESGGTSKQRVRATDNAKAWRCSLQAAGAGARRLHWWVVTDAQGVLIELAQVGLHDDFSIR